MGSEYLSRTDKKTAAVIVNFNGRETVGKCIESILKQGDAVSVIYVVDNNSSDNSPEYIADNFPGVTLLRSGDNVGFSKANNIALKRMQTEYAAIINPDVELPQNAIKVMTDFIEERPDVGLIGPKLVRDDGTFDPTSKMGKANVSNTIYKFVGLSKLFPTSELFAGYYLGHLDKDIISQVNAVSGACMVAKVNLLEKIGYFDEMFPLGCEDIDLCYRLSALAKVYYYPEVTAVHKGKHSRKRYPELSIRRFNVGAKILYQRYEASNHSTFFNKTVLRCLDFAAVARIALTRIHSLSSKQL